MTLEDHLIQGLVEKYHLGGKNIQGILGNQMFKDLPLDAKVKFINSYREELRNPPKFNWSRVAKAGVSGAVAGVSSAVTAGVLRGRPNPLTVSVLSGLGLASGALVGAGWAIKEHREGQEISNSVDDAIKLLINKSVHSPGQPPVQPALVRHFSALPGKYTPGVIQYTNRT